MQLKFLKVQFAFVTESRDPGKYLTLRCKIMSCMYPYDSIDWNNDITDENISLNT